MPKTRFAILIVDPSVEESARLAEFLEARGQEVRVVSGGSAALDLATGGKRRFDAVITAYQLEELNGLELISRLHSAEPRLPLIMLTAHGNSDTAIEAIKNGAYDYFTKPANYDEIYDKVLEAVESARRMSTPVEIGEVYPEQDTIIGRSRAMTEIYKELGRIASKPVTVLIRGETGTGKELIARAIYQHGHRAHQPFIAVNCAAIPSGLLESELFGHEKGAFTGADKLKKGRFEQAHNGTLFLDEIGDMDLALQAKLLRVLQEKRIQRIGGHADVPVDVRVIAATHRNLEEMLDDEAFRTDLFYRLNVVSMTIPPLRDRREDIEPLVDYWLRLYGADFGFDSPAILSEGMKFLSGQEWPGNVRQLQNVIRRALLGSRGYTLDWKDLRDAYEESEAYVPVRRPAETESLRSLAEAAVEVAARGDSGDAWSSLVSQTERELLAAAMKRSGGNQAQAARWLGISRLTLREKLHKHHLHPSDEKAG